MQERLDKYVFPVFQRQPEQTGEIETMKIVMLGAPGAGKGTQAEMIAVKYGIPHISTGDIFRYNIKNGTDLGKEAKKYMDEGKLVPDELTVRLLLDRVAKDDCGKAEVLTKELEKQGAKVDFAINVDVPDEDIVRRMGGRRACVNCGATYHVVYAAPKVEGICDKCGSKLVLRDDDKPETVQKRLKVYHEQTQPLIEYYEKQGVLRTVDGTRDLHEVFADITAILEKN